MAYLPRFCLLALLTALLAPAAALADSPPRDKEVFGWLEKAIVMPVGATVKVKLDSGALTSSMDARQIKLVRRQGKRWVRFVLHLEDKASGEAIYRELALPVKRMVRLRGAGGVDRRPTVVIPICIGKRVYQEEFTLRDRDNMLYPVLIGRSTLRHLGLIDTTATFLNPPRCPLPEPLAADKRN